MGDRPSSTRLATRGLGNQARPRRRRLPVNRRREELIAVALELFSAEPIENVSIDDVARAAGVSRALMYHYFPGKRELYVAALRHAAKELVTRFQARDKTAHPLEQLRDAIGRFFDYVEEHANGFMALMGARPGGRTGERARIIESARQAVLSQLAEGMMATEPTPILRMTMRSWMASVEVTAVDWLQHHDIPRSELEKIVVERFLYDLQIAAARDCYIADLVARHSKSRK